jgi:type I restriction enzyme S subunit
MSIPAGWVQTTIGEVVDFQGGTQPPKSEFVYEAKPGYVRLVQIRDFRSDEYKTFIPRSLARNSFGRDDVMIGRYGPPVFQILRGLEGAYNVALIKALPDLNKMSKDFLYLVLQQESLFKLIDGLSRRSAGQAGVDMDALRSFPLLLPPPPIQEIISDRVDLLTQGIGKLTDLISFKLRFKQGVMRRLLSGKLRFVDQSAGWNSVRLSDVTAECSDRNRGYLGLESVMAVTKAEGIVPMRERSIGASLDRYLVVKKNCFAYNPMRINIGSIARWQGDNDILVSPDYVVFRCKEKSKDGPGLDPDYLDHFRRSKIWEKFVIATGNGSVRIRIYYAELSRLKINLPSVAEQKKIAKLLNAMDREIDLLRKQLELLKLQKKGLMQKLLTGQVRVKLPKGAK